MICITKKPCVFSCFGIASLKYLTAHSNFISFRLGRERLAAFDINIFVYMNKGKVLCLPNKMESEGQIQDVLQQNIFKGLILVL